MSRRKLKHATLDRQIHVYENKHSSKNLSVEIVTRGSAENYRANHNIHPRGLRPAAVDARRKARAE